MAHLLHIDSSIQGDRSISRALSARAAARWRAANPDGTVTYRDLAADPLPHLGPAGAEARFVPADQHNEAQAASWALSAELIGEVAAADTILLGLPLYNFGPPSTVKAWVDHLIAPGLSMDPATGDGLLGGPEMIVLARPRRRLRRGDAARGLGPRPALAPARGLPDRPRAALHHRRADPRRRQPADGRPARARRRQPEGRRGRGRRALATPVA